MSEEKPQDDADASAGGDAYAMPTAAVGTVQIDKLLTAADGSDKGTFGLNTPAYFAMDDFTVTAVPEPTSLAAALATVACGLQQFRSRRRHA
jgi:hypothetical protein